MLSDLQLAHNDFLDAVEQEGLDYAVIHYSNWQKLSHLDPGLGHLILNFREAYDVLDEHIETLRYVEEE